MRPAHSTRGGKTDAFRHPPILRHLWYTGATRGPRLTNSIVQRPALRCISSETVTSTAGGSLQIAIDRHYDPKGPNVRTAPIGIRPTALRVARIASNAPPLLSRRSTDPRSILIPRGPFTEPDSVSLSRSLFQQVRARAIAIQSSNARATLASLQLRTDVSLLASLYSGRGKPVRCAPPRFPRSISLFLSLDIPPALLRQVLHHVPTQPALSTIPCPANAPTSAPRHVPLQPPVPRRASQSLFLRTPLPVRFFRPSSAAPLLRLRPFPPDASPLC